MTPDDRTLAELAQEAIEIQDACNLSGLVFGWARCMERFNQLLPGIGTDARNKHPIHYLWSDKLASLTGAQLPESGQYSAQYDACKKLAAVARKD